MTYINLARTIRITYRARSQEHDCEQYSNQTFVPGAYIDREDVGWGSSGLSAVCCFMCVRVRSYFDRVNKLVADFVTKPNTNMPYDIIAKVLKVGPEYSSDESGDGPKRDKQDSKNISDKSVSDSESEGNDTRPPTPPKPRGMSKSKYKTLV